MGSSESNKQAREESFLLSCWHISKLMERPYSRLLQKMKPGSIILNRKQWAVHGILVYSMSLEKKIQKFSISREGHDHGVILVDAVPGQETVKFDAYIRALKELRKYFMWVWPHKNPTEIFLQHDSAKPYINLKTGGIVTQFGWTVLPHPSYSPSLASLDFHLFRAGRMKST